MAAQIAIFLYNFGVRIYLSLTRCGRERLIVVGFEKQLKAGMKNEGICGVDNLTGGGCAAGVAMASIESASSKPGRGSCCLLEDYGRCFREGRKEGDG